ncbi:ABC transporter ATP-binding protein [Micromonospora sp. CPCC 206061]|uniref:ABC transporter ATP-binding protein n=1 Tax=Micromonospora sp. CPCC 206061 TaxID=3122410 RepID=UPI002FF10ABE
MTAALRVENLTVRYPNGVVAVRGLDLHVAEGEAVALVGDSGSGKSTVVRAVLGLLPPGTIRSGRVWVGGRDVTAASGRELRRLRGTGVGYVAQDPYGACDPVWTVGHHVAEAWYAHRLRPTHGVVARRLADLGVSAMRRHRPHTWSGGMLQRATIAAATAHAPPLVVADEPTSALDADLAADVLRLLRERSRALLLVTHDHATAERCDRRLVLHHGRLVDAPCPPVERSRAKEPTKGQTGVPVVELAGVTLRAGQRPLVTGIDLTIHPGEIVGVVGPSGVGKTTLLDTLAALRPLAAGTIRFAGQPSPPPGYVMPIFQDATASLDPRWPIWQTVAEPLPTPDRNMAVRLLHRVGLTAVDPDARPRHLSGGQQQRVAIARALAARPALLIADEPVSRLDTTAAAGIYTVLSEVADAGTAVVVASHDAKRLASLADRLLRLTAPL